MNMSLGQTPAARLESVDLLRGLVMVVMVLDHVRDIITDTRIDPTDLDRSTPALFFTRWITHFCAPTFIFLAGTGAFLAGSRRKSRSQLAIFLLTRGIWLIFLEDIWGLLGLLLGTPKILLAFVLSAIGWSMIALAGLIFVPRWLVASISLAMIALHNGLDGIHAPETGIFSMLWTILHEPGTVRLGGGFSLIVKYPLIPWIGVLASGYAFGPILMMAPEHRRRIIIRLGLALISGFFLLRATKFYGDPHPWMVRSTLLGTIMSFLNCEKYPPSLLYLLMTLGPSILALGLLDRGLPGWLSGPFRTFGRVPLFYYLLQWPLIVALFALISAMTGRSLRPSFDLPMVYSIWIVALAMLYGPCRWFSRLKSRRSDAWLSYL